MANLHSSDRWPPGTRRDVRGGSPAPRLELKARKVAQAGFRICIGTHNLHGGLNWKPNRHSHKQAKDYSDWLDENHGILLLQDTGVVSESVPGDARSHFGSNFTRTWGNV